MNVHDPRVLRLLEALVPVIEMMTAPKRSEPSTVAYVSNKRGPHPPGKSARWCRDHFRHIPGARKEGRDWVLPVADYDRWAASSTAAAFRRSPVPPAGAGWTPATALASAMVRPSRGKP